MRRSPLFSVLLVAAIGSASLEATANAEAVPTPASGRFSSTVLALLHYQRDLCGGALERVEERFQTSRGSDAEQEAAVRTWAFEQVSSDLAAGRSAGDLASRFLSGARTESGDRIATDLDRLRIAVAALCDAAALPSGPRDKFAIAVATRRERVEVASAALGRAMAVDDAQLSELLEPYLISIQMAAVEAEGQLMEEADARRPPPPTDRQRLQAAMDAWHASYLGSTTEVKKALGAVLGARRQQDASALRSACKRLTTSVVPVLRNDGLFRAPDPRVSQPLQRAYQTMQLLAGDCLAGRFTGVDERFRTVQGHLADAARVLAPYSLRP